MSTFNSEEATGLEIAVIGMSGRFPRARNVQELWNNLRNGVEGVTFFPDSELAAESLADLQNSNFVKAGGVIGNATHFDAAFFGINPREAELMDPQHRIFLECAWEALEDAGYDPETCPETIGVYAGAGLNRYLFLNILANPHIVKSAGIFQITIGNEKDFLATQVSYRLNLRGPSISVQTACSTSLVAVHLACQGLISGEADLALAGGVSVLVPENTGYHFEEGSINSPDGHCRPFDVQAAGTLRSNGAGIVVLKRLGDAVAARDNILAIIKGSAVNNDGSRKMGYTAPSVDGQVRVIMAAQAMAGVAPETIQYVEAHGTGTHLGDPIEMKALSQAFRNGGDRRRSACALGSLKSNLGHLDTAAGVSGLIKAVLALHYEEIPPTLHFRQPNPELDLESSPFYINPEPKVWAKGNTVRRAGVSAFGIGGTNAHVVVEETPDMEASGPGRPWNLIIQSAKSESALRKMASDLSVYGRQHSEVNLADAAFTLALGRSAHRVRSAVVACDLAEACDKLERGVGLQHGEASESEPPVVFMFPGQGAQYQAMGKQLYQIEPAFRKAIDDCFTLLQPLMQICLPDLLEGRIGESELQQTQITQPALFVMEYALAQLWMSWGVRPKAMIGHSVGEYVAACLAGVMALEEGLGLIALRGRLMQSLPPGGMLHLRMNEHKARHMLPSGVDLAVVNGQDFCVVAGPEEVLATFQEELQKIGASGTRLKTSHAFHSAMTEPILEEFRSAVKQIKLQAPRLPFVSNVTGNWITPEQAQNPDYWVQHLRGTVRFGDGIELLLQQQTGSVFLEVGPGKTLSQFVQVASQSSKDKRKPKAIIAGIGAGTNESSQRAEYPGLLESLGLLWSLGVCISWSGFYQEERRRRISLPTYPFERQQYCLKPGWGKIGVRTSTERRKIDDWFYLPSWKRSLVPAAARANQNTQGQAKTCILFTDRSTAGNDLGAKLEEENWQVVWISAGKEFQKVDSRHFEMWPGSEEDWMLLLHELKNVIPEKIAHFWNATATDDSRDFEEIMDRSFYGLLYLAKGIAAQSLHSKIDILLASCGVHAVESGDRPDPLKAPLLGPCRILPQEFPGIRCTNVDMTWTDEGTPDRRRVVEQLLREFKGAASDPVVAYRGQHRWVQSWEGTFIEKDASAVQLRDDGVYLITGGMGGLGLELAEYISSAINSPRLLLLGRTPFPPGNQWESWLLEHVASDPICEKIRRLQKMQAKGAVMHIIQGDVSSKADMERVREEIAWQGKVNGIVHAAGVAGGGLLQLRGRTEVASVLAPKIQGTLNLHEFFPDLDFLVLCSSVTAVLGGIGQADYCAANAFMDAFATTHFALENSRILSINWDAWQEVGMAVHTIVPREWEADRASTLRDAIKPVEGKTVFERVLGARLPQVVVSTHDFPERVREAQATQLPRAADMKMPETRYARPESAGQYEAAIGPLEIQLAGIWSQFLGIEPVGRNDDFFALGGHSLLAIQLISRVREVFRVEVQMGSVFENSTPASFARILLTLESQPGEMEQIAQIMNDIGAMSESELMEALEQGRLGATQA